jgi:hypothetical protein
MRIRTIKPEFWQSERLSTVSREARLLFVGLWSMADDSGRTRAASRLLASTLFPYDEDARGLIDGWLAELSRIGAVRVYEVDSCHYLEIPKWLEHQKIDKPSKSKLPAFGEGSENPREDSRKIALDQGREGKGEEAPPPPAAGVTRPKEHWPHIQRTPWYLRGIRAGCRISASNWPSWAGAIARTGDDYDLFFEKAESMPPDKRWFDKIEAAISEQPRPVAFSAEQVALFDELSQKEIPDAG